MTKQVKSPMITLYNCSRQMIPLQVRAPGSDFYTNEQQIRLGSGKTVTLPKSHVRLEQIDNLRKRRILSVVHDDASSLL